METGGYCLHRIYEKVSCSDLSAGKSKYFLGAQLLSGASDATYELMPRGTKVVVRTGFYPGRHLESMPRSVRTHHVRE